MGRQDPLRTVFAPFSTKVLRKNVSKNIFSDFKTVLIEFNSNSCLFRHENCIQKWVNTSKTLHGVTGVAEVTVEVWIFFVNFRKFGVNFFRVDRFLQRFFRYQNSID